MNSTIRLFAIFSVLILTGLGCSKPVAEEETLPIAEPGQAEERDSLVYENTEKGYSFEHPSGFGVSEELNGSPYTHKFVVEDKGYIVSFSEYRGNIDYSSWEDVPQAEVSVTFFDDREVYREYEHAHAEAFYTTFDPPVSIAIWKEDGSNLNSPISTEGDEIFAELLDTMKFLDAPVFNK